MMARRGSGFLTMLAALLTIGGCEKQAKTLDLELEGASSEKLPIQQEVFVDVAAETGLNFVHFIGATGKFYFVEQLGSGGALLDYDGDGDLDIYLVQGAMLGEHADNAAASIFQAPKAQFPGNRLFQNRLIPDGQLRFEDVTVAAGVGDEGYGMGVAVADFDNDGRPDLFVSNFGPDVLYRNDGDGSFSDITPATIALDDGWSTSASFFRLDDNNLPDLYVARYTDYSLIADKRCENLQGAQIYCEPDTYLPAVDRLYQNGGGRFEDVSRGRGLYEAFGAGLGVVSADFNGDQLVDVYVANDGDANLLWMNRGAEGWEDTGHMAGAAFNVDGKTEASMGVTAGDFDGDGDEDLFMTHFDNETNTLYVNDGNGIFSDETARLKLGVASLPFTGFGSRWFDLNNDGRLDLFVANGAVLAQGDQVGQSDYPYAETNQLFEQDENGQFRDVSKWAGQAMALKEVSRGAAFGDIDNDGDIDVLVTNNNGPVRLLRNDVGNQQAWLSVRLIGTRSNRDGAGARVALLRDGQKPLWRRAHTDGSYLSASDIRVHFGLGEAPATSAVGVIWPSGHQEQWTGIEPNAFITLKEGSGHPWAP